MLELLFVPTAILYLLVVMLLFVYGMNFFYLTTIAWRRQNIALSTPTIVQWPRVTVQLPIFNELYVAERLIRAAAALDYPAELLEIQALDDSSDETLGLVAHEVEAARARGINVVHLHRTVRSGFKAGALANGLAQSNGQFLAIFDADFIPPPDYLRRTLPHFADQRAAFIQTRWGHVNRSYSLLTFLQSLAIDAHFMVEQFARSQSQYLFNFNGTAGIWRREALIDAGGWTSDTLTEDLDLSYRAFLRGWHALYLREVEVPAELPVNFVAYRRQQHRWARGSFECAIKLLPRVWEAPFPLAKKIEATLHLTGYAVHLLLCALVILYPIIIGMSLHYPELIALFGLAFLCNATAFAPTLFFAVAQQQLGRRWWLLLPVIIFITALGAGMMLNTVRAAFQILFKHGAVFERTPKFGISRPHQDWVRRRYQLSVDPIIYAEIALGILNAGTVVAGFATGNWVIALYAALFSVGLFFTSGVTIFQAIEVRRSRGQRLTGPTTP